MPPSFLKNHCVSLGLQQPYDFDIIFSSRWVQGFLNRKVGFVDSKTICYPSGNYVVFVHIETKERSYLRCKNGNIGAFTVSGNQHVIAFSDRQLNPSIHIYQYQGLKKLAKLKGTVFFHLTKIQML